MADLFFSLTNYFFNEGSIVYSGGPFYFLKLVKFAIIANIGSWNFVPTLF